MSFHGGLIGVDRGLWLFCRRRNSISCGSAISSPAPHRSGCFSGASPTSSTANCGERSTDVPWAMVFCTPHILATNGGRCPAGYLPRHPSQLYEAALEGLAAVRRSCRSGCAFSAARTAGTVLGVFFLPAMARSASSSSSSASRTHRSSAGSAWAWRFRIPMWLRPPISLVCAHGRKRAVVNALGERIATLIEARGPLSDRAIHDHGAARSGGWLLCDARSVRRGGDFITAPEISQIFGELIGLVVRAGLDRPGTSRTPARLVELGPGRGTLMADALRAAKLVPEFLAAIDVVLVEASPALQTLQKERLRDCGVSVRWTRQFRDTPATARCF